MKKGTVILIIIGLILLILLNAFLFFRSMEIKKDIAINNLLQTNYPKTLLNRSICPGARAGNPEALLRIKYFYNGFCPWCIKQEPVLNELLSIYDNIVYIQWYNFEECGADAEKYNVVGVPSFVFSKKGDDKFYTGYGYISKEEFEKYICEVYGGCIMLNSSVEK